MRSFGINIKGRTKNFNLPKSQPLIPLFEAIVNSFHSIEERRRNEESFNSGEIIIEIERDGQGSFDETLNSEILNISVKDNGVGFDENNFSSFLESDSTYKEAIGGKGVGRFSWLRAFEKAIIKSIYNSDGVYVKREFEFSLLSNSIEDTLVDVVANDNSTTVLLKGFLSPYRITAPKQLSTIAIHIIHHCLVYFIDKNCPRVILKDEDNIIDLNELFEEKIKPNENSVLLNFEGSDYELLHVKVEDSTVNTNKLFLCAHNRLVEVRDLDKYIVDLDRSIYEKNGFWYIGVLRGKYLDDNVDMNRLSFAISVANIEELISTVTKEIESFLKEYLEPISILKKTNIKQYVTSKAPQFRHLLKYMEEDVNSIKPNLSEEKLDDELYTIKRKFDKKIKQQNGELLELLQNGTISQDDYEEKFQKQVVKVNEANSAILAEYIVHRKIIIDLLQAAIYKKNDNKFELESYIHDLIYPMRTTSEETPYDYHNLWLLDEKLSYCTYISSDVPFSNKKGESRADIMILDNPVAVSDDLNLGKEFDTIVLFEIKRPMRNDYNDTDNPVTQLYRYVDKIKTNSVEDKNGRIIHVGENTKFYLYAICDVTPKLENVLKHSGIFKRTPDKLGYYGYNDSYNAYVEILPYDKIINDSQKRNRILFEKLGL